MKILRNGECCPFCGARELRRYAVHTNDKTIGPRTVKVVECRHCITAWQWPEGFTEADTQAYYKVQYTNAEASAYYDPEYKDSVTRIEYDFLESVTTGRGTLLDVGAGAGFFVEFARSHGWEARGVDLSYSSDLVQKGTIGDISEVFDVVTMWDVIEHVEDPEEVIGQASQRLVDGGVLVLETGNYMCTDRILNEDGWWAFHPDHRWYHAPGVLEGLLRKAGLQPVQYATHNLRPNARIPGTYAGPSATEFLLRAAKRPYRIPELIRQFGDLQTSAQRCPHLSNIGIFALAARR